LALYEYACSSCEHRFERIMKRGARAPRCPECGSSTQRQISAPAIHFKGSGWYVTDYARKGKKDGAAGSSGDGGDKKEKAAGKDTPAKASESKSSGSKKPAKK
jgi:putative FmdB family regulatory protein